MVGQLKPADRINARWVSYDEPSSKNPPQRPILIVYVLMNHIGPVVFAMQFSKPPIVDDDYWKLQAHHEYYFHCQNILVVGPPT